jgi:hypothetical protein
LSSSIIPPPAIRLLLPPPAVVVAGEDEVVGGGAVMVGAEDDEDGDEDDDDVVVPGAAVVSSVAAVPPPAAAPFCVKSIVCKTGSHFSAAAPNVITGEDAHNSKLLTLAGIVTLIGSMMAGAASFPLRTIFTSMPIFLVERLLLLVVADVVGDDETPASPSAP